MANIRIGCATMVVRDGKVLLGKRGKEPGYGALVIPGGGIDLYEKFEDTAKREIKEETGLEIKNLKQFGVYQIINQEKENHRVIIYWQAEYKGGELTPASDLLDAKFYSSEEIKKEIDAGNLSKGDASWQVLKDAGWLK